MGECPITVHASVQGAKFNPQLQPAALWEQVNLGGGGCCVCVCV